jgi:glucose-1-phosphate thymidylyltransferase
MRFRKLFTNFYSSASVIGENCIIENSYLHERWNSKILNSSIEYSVNLEGAQTIDVERLEESLIGRSAKVTKNRERRFIRLNLGDYSEVSI